MCICFRMASKTYKTYSKFSGKDTAASRAFDDVLNNKTAPPVPIKAEKTKWGDTSFTRVRKDDPFQVTFNKVKVENETVDEFSFDLEEDESLKKKLPANNSSAQSAPTGLGRPAIASMNKTPKKQAQPESPGRPTKVEKEDNESVENDEDDDLEPVMFKRPVRTYSRSVKKEKAQENETEQGQSDDPCEISVVEENAEDDDDDESIPFSQKTDVFSDQTDEEGNSYKRGGKGRSQKITSRTHILQSDDDESSGATVLNFRSRYMDPAVYGNFEYKPQGEDPVGRMNNSKVLQQSEIKHGKGSTLIVICSPKPPAQGASKLHPVRTYKVRDPNEKESDDGEGKSKQDLYQAIPAKPIIIRNRRRPQKRKAEDTSSKTCVPPIETLINLKQEPKYAPAPPKDSNRSKDAKPRRNKIFKSRNKVEVEDEEEEKDTSVVLSEDKNVSEEAPVLLPEVDMAPEGSREGSDVSGEKDNAFGFGEMEVEEAEEETPDIVEKETFEEIPVKLKRVDEIQKEDNGDSQSSEGELENSQELPSSQDSTDDFKQPNRERKIFKSKNTRMAQKKVYPSPKKVLFFHKTKKMLLVISRLKGRIFFGVKMISTFFFSRLQKLPIMCGPGMMILMKRNG